MGAPATQGRLCTNLEEMQIGDYIRCTYTADTANVAGVFSDLGGTNLEMLELPTTPAETADGFFYFLKADKGLLIADRLIQTDISAQSLNMGGYISGKFLNKKQVRILTKDEWSRYLTNSDLNGCIIKQDFSVWNSLCSNTASLPDCTYLEIVQDSVGNHISTTYNINGLVVSGIYHGYLAAASNIKRAVPVLQNFIADYSEYSIGLKYRYVKLSFRPVIEYIDNSYSKTIYY